MLWQLVIGNWAFGIWPKEQCNNLLEWPQNNRFPVPSYQSPKQPLLYQLYHGMFDFHGPSATILCTVKVMLHRTICNDDFLRNTALQHCSNIATLCCAQNHCCESSHVTYMYLKIVWSSTIRQSIVWQVHLMIFSYPRFWRMPLVCFRVLSDGEPDYKWCVGDWNNPLTFSRKK